MKIVQFPSTPRRLIGPALVMTGLFLLDQITKACVVRWIAYRSLHPVIPEIFSLTHLVNKGAAWGIFSGRAVLLLSISLVAFVLLVRFMDYITEGYTERYYAVFMILSGILGNCTDRIFRGAVVDFLQVYLGTYAWPAFNVADSAICCGVGLYILSTIIRPDKSKRKKDSSVSE